MHAFSSSKAKAVVPKPTLVEVVLAKPTLAEAVVLVDVEATLPTPPMLPLSEPVVEPASGVADRSAATATLTAALSSPPPVAAPRAQEAHAPSPAPTGRLLQRRRTVEAPTQPPAAVASVPSSSTLGCSGGGSASDASLPGVTELPTAGAAIMTGKVELDGPFFSLEGRWRTFHDPAVSSEFVWKGKERAPLDAMRNPQLSHSGLYEGHFYSKLQGTDIRRDEARLYLSFTRNASGGWNATGSNTNVCGSFKLIGFVKADWTFEIAKVVDVEMARQVALTSKLCAINESATRPAPPTRSQPNGQDRANNQAAKALKASQAASAEVASTTASLALVAAAPIVAPAGIKLQQLFAPRAPAAASSRPAVGVCPTGRYVAEARAPVGWSVQSGTAPTKPDTRGAVKRRQSLMAPSETSSSASSPAAPRQEFWGTDAVSQAAPLASASASSYGRRAPSRDISEMGNIFETNLRKAKRVTAASKKPRAVASDWEEEEERAPKRRQLGRVASSDSNWSG